MICKNIKRCFRFIERRVWFFVLQIFLIIIAYIAISDEMFIQTDYSSWKLFNKIRNQTDEIKEHLYYNLNDITLVSLDEKFFTHEKVSVQWIHRWYYAKVINNINKYNPKVVGIDIFFQNKFNFSEKDENWKLLNKIFWKYDDQLIQSIKSSNVLSVIKDHKNNKILEPDKSFTKNNPWLWHVNAITYDKDIYLWVTAQIQDNEIKNTKYPLSLIIYLEQQITNLKTLYWDIIFDFEILYDWTFLTVKWNNVNLSIPTIEPLNKNILPNTDNFIFTPMYITDDFEQNNRLYNSNINYISFYDVLTENPQSFDENLFKNKTVLIWATDMVLNDIKLSLSWFIPWVYIHINQLLSFQMKDFIYILNKSETTTLILAFLIINMIVLWIIRNSWSNRHIIFLLLIESLSIIIICILLGQVGLSESLKQFSTWFSIFLPMWTLLSLIFIQITINLGYSLIETHFIKENYHKLISLYVWEKLANKSIKDYDDVSQMNAEEKNLTIFFSDIVWFTDISENLSPVQNIKFLNTYLEKMSEIIALNWWFIDKYIWDAIMAFRENDDWPNKATISAILTIKHLNSITQTVKKTIWESFSNHTINVRIWLNYWKAIVWDIWAEKYKLNHTVIWDTVNLSSRLEWINKYYGTQIIASQYFIDKIKDSTQFIYRKIDKIKVKWKDIAVWIYEIYPIFKSELETNEIITRYSLIKMFEDWLNKYIKWNFKNAIEIFEKINSVKTDPIVKLFIERCYLLKENPPQNWDGIWKYDSK